jgi:putative ABC transport system permease protein
MNTQFFTIFFRRRLNNKLLSGINLLNLVAGYSAYVVLNLVIQYNLNYDKHNLNYDRIYRLQMFMDVPQSVSKHSSSVTAALGRQDLPRLPEVDYTALVHNAGEGNLDGYFFSADKSKPVLLRMGFFADPAIFNIFTFNFIEGSGTTALSEPNSVVLSKSDALKFFPQGKAVGRTLYIENKIALTVTGVYEDLPKNSDWRPEYLLPMLDYSQYTGNMDYETNYWHYTFQVYTLLKEHASDEEVNNKIYNALKDYREYHHPYLRPLSKLHLNGFFEPTWWIAVGLLILIAVLILILTSINFINLQTADATSRSKEIGIKKSVGYTYRELWFQYVGESVFETMICAFLALAIAHYSMPLFYRILGDNLGLKVFANTQLLGIVAGTALLTGILSSLYPAYIISHFNPVQALKQRFINVEHNGLSLKKVLVTMQFSISLFLVIVSFIIFRQTNYMITKDMGFESRDLLIGTIKTSLHGSFDPVRGRLLEHPEIANACFSDYVPFILPMGDDMSWEGALPEDKVFVRVSNVSYDFFDTYGMKIIAGRSFSRDFPADIDKCLVNEAAVRIFGWKEPVGMKIRYRNNDREVIGVVKDYVAQSVQNEIEPHSYRLKGDSISLTGMYTVRYEPGKKREAEQIIRNSFDEYFPTDAFEFEPFENLILNEAANRGMGLFRNICFLFAGFSILISSAGLFGLVLYYCRKKMKEIGIKKVVGFSVSRLYMNLAMEFLMLIFIGMIFSWAAAWYVYRVIPGADKYGLQLGEFLLGTLIIFIVAVGTISYNIWIAARTNPSSILKYE